MSKKKDTQKASLGRESVVDDWQPLFAAVKDVIDWALDIAVKLSRHCPDDIDAIENVRVCFHAWLDGKPSEMEVNDLLLTIATILSAIELDLGIDSVEMLAPLRSHIAMQPTMPRTLHFPGATRDEKPTVVIRRFPRHRNANAAFTQFAA